MFLENPPDKEEAKKRLGKYNFKEQEKTEVAFHVEMETAYPSPLYRYRLITEQVNQYIEEAYYWFMFSIQQDYGFTHVEKLTDVFASSEQSSFFGVAEQRLGLQQEKAAQYLKGISEMIKALFQIVRELRIIDERLTFYMQTFTSGKSAQGSEISLKGIWVDQVEGGTRNAASLLGLAQPQGLGGPGFVVLPDFFFKLSIDDTGMHEAINDTENFNQRIQVLDLKLQAEIDKIDTNNKVKEVLKRKLTQYYIWKYRTFRELYVRRRFTLKYLRQHYNTIKLYMGWIKPYLRHIKRMQQDQNKIESAQLVSAFEGAMVEVEVMLRKEGVTTYVTPVIIIHYLYRARPSLQYVQEGFQRGPAHTGKLEVTLRGYVWTPEEIHNYKLMREEEELDLIKNIDETIAETMNELGDELKAYLQEEGEQFPEVKHRDDRKPKQNFFEPFAAVFLGFKEIFGSFGKIEFGGGGHKVSALAFHEDVSKAKGHLEPAIWNAYKDYKKLHGMMTW